MEKSKRSYRRYDPEFKKEAVRLVLEEGIPLARVSRDLGINENMLHRWKSQYLEDPVDAFPGKGYLKPQDEELRRLRRELDDVRQERDILKKALAIFSKGPR